MLASPQNSCWNLTPNAVIVRGGTFGKWLGHDGRTLINGINVLIKEGFSNDSGKESACQCKRGRRHGFDLWVRKSPWTRKWQPAPVFLPEKYREQRSLAGYSLVQFSHLVVSNSLRPYGLQHTRLSYPSPTPEACSNSCSSCQWCHPTISSSVTPFSSCLQSLPASGSSTESALFIRWPKYWSFSFIIVPSNEYSELISFRIDWFDHLAVFSNTTVQEHQFFGTQFPLWSNSPIHILLLEKP